MRKKGKFLILLNMFSISAFAQPSAYTTARDSELTKMISLLKQDDFNKIYPVKDKIVNYQKAAIPLLIEMLKDTSFVKLKNTADLIYPGATDFYGHGGILAYDIDWLPIRAAWLLENITFKNFGYLKLSHHPESLGELYKKNHVVYIDHNLSALTPEDIEKQKSLRLHMLKLADTVERWWQQNKEGWTRFRALKEALVGNDLIEQENAIRYMLSDQTVCEGLTVSSYNEEIKPLIKRFLHGNEYLFEYANRLYDSDPARWLSWKVIKN